MATIDEHSIQNVASDPFYYLYAVLHVHKGQHCRRLRQRAIGIRIVGTLLGGT